MCRVAATALAVLLLFAAVSALLRHSRHGRTRGRQIKRSGDYYEGPATEPPPVRSHHGDIVTRFLRIVESQQQLGENCTAGTALNLGEGVVDRYAQVRRRLGRRLLPASPQELLLEAPIARGIHTNRLMKKKKKNQRFYNIIKHYSNSTKHHIQLKLFRNFLCRNRKQQ
ncbi:unnamed protein product [Nezara viridula]|uniref:Neuropeptide n=1 Tax=Nezara viridula TaxID=85310 RepID=A0A9P0EDT3_NEZVI|nr:unnamed protein product [Nezara viridula]